MRTIHNIEYKQNAFAHSLAYTSCLFACFINAGARSRTRTQVRMRMRTSSFVGVLSFLDIGTHDEGWDEQEALCLLTVTAAASLFVVRNLVHHFRYGEYVYIPFPFTLALCSLLIQIHRLQRVCYERECARRVYAESARSTAQTHTHTHIPDMHGKWKYLLLLFCSIRSFALPLSHTLACLVCLVCLQPCNVWWAALHIITLCMYFLWVSHKIKYRILYLTMQG